MARSPVKVLLHHFMPNADDRDTHDHPRPFWTLVLRGGYDDMVLCNHCRGGRTGSMDGSYDFECPFCVDGLIAGDRMRAGMLRFRPATYAHRSRVLPSGCWTIVLMGPFRRPWGFWREGKWWSFRDYQRTFGFGMRCGDEDRS